MYLKSWIIDHLGLFQGHFPIPSMVLSIDSVIDLLRFNDSTNIMVVTDRLLKVITLNSMNKYWKYQTSGANHSSFVADNSYWSPDTTNWLWSPYHGVECQLHWCCFGIVSSSHIFQLQNLRVFSPLHYYQLTLTSRHINIIIRILIKTC